MDGGTPKWGKVIGISLGVVVLGAAVVWAGKYWLDRRAEHNLQAKLSGGNAQDMRQALLTLDQEKLKSEQGKKTLDLTVERMKNMSFAEIMEVLRAQDLSEEQQRRLREVGPQLMRTYMDKQVDEYFIAPQDQRQAVLDRHLDEWQEFQQQMQGYHEEHKDDPEYQAERDRERERWQKRDTQQAKERMESSDPDRQKRMFFYWGQMRARAEARGLDMGRGWGGGSGGDRSDRPRRSGREG